MILTSSPLTIGGLTAEETTVSLVLQTVCSPTGNKTSAVTTGQRFIRDGDATIPVGPPIVQVFSDIYALAATDPNIATEVGIITAALGRLAPMIGL